MLFGRHIFSLCVKLRSQDPDSAGSLRAQMRRGIRMRYGEGPVRLLTKDRYTVSQENNAFGCQRVIQPFEFRDQVSSPSSSAIRSVTETGV